MIAHSEFNNPRSSSALPFAITRDRVRSGIWPGVHITSCYYSQNKKRSCFSMIYILLKSTLASLSSSTFHVPEHPIINKVTISHYRETCPNSWRIRQKLSGLFVSRPADVPLVLMGCREPVTPAISLKTVRRRRDRGQRSRLPKLIPIKGRAFISQFLTAFLRLLVSFSLLLFLL